MDCDILLELARKLKIDPYEIKKYNCIFKDLEIIPGSVSVIVEPEIIIKKIHFDLTKPNAVKQTLKDGFVVAKQKNGNSILIKLRCCEPTWEDEKRLGKKKKSKKAEKVKIEYVLFLLEDGLYFVHNYNIDNMSDTVEFSYYSNDTCNQVLDSNKKLDMTTLSKFSKKEIRSDYSDSAKIVDILNDGSFLSYVSKIEKNTSKNKGAI